MAHVIARVPIAPTERLDQDLAREKVDALRAQCELASGGAQVLYALRICLASGTDIPGWLAYSFVERYDLVRRAECMSWNDMRAFGPAWPKWTRGGITQRKLRQQAVVHAVCCDLAAREPSLALGTEFFKTVADRLNAERLGGLSPSTAKARYYEAVEAGLPSVAAGRRALRFDFQSSDEKSRKHLRDQASRPTLNIETALRGWKEDRDVE